MSPSLSLVTIAALTPRRHKVTIQDENIQPLSYDGCVDVVGITVTVDTAFRATRIAQEYKSRGAKVIFGGIHASANPDALLEHGDAICIGEAEVLWPRILDDVENDSLLPRYENEHPVDLTLVPMPRWDLIDSSDYLYNNIVVASRGCPYKCDFCYNSCDYVKGTYRNRPVDDVIAEVTGHNTRQIMFIDDNFLGNIAWVDEFLSASEHLGLTWHCAATANLVNHAQIIPRLAKAGCRSIFIGFESINENSIQSVGKGQNKVQSYEKLISLLHDNGIMVNASLTFGFDHDDESVFEKTMKWLVKNKVETMTGHILTPYPGTVLYKKFAAEGRIIDFDLSKYNTSNVVYQPALMDPEVLRRGYLSMYDEFYSLKNIFRRMPDHPKLKAPYLLFNLAYRKYGRITAALGRLGFMRSIGQWARKLSYGID